MILNKNTYCRKHLIKHFYNNISGLKETLKQTYQYIDEILINLEYTYNKNNDGDYLSNILNTEEINELISISNKWDITNKDYPYGDYKKI